MYKGSEDPHRRQQKLFKQLRHICNVLIRAFSSFHQEIGKKVSAFQGFQLQLILTKIKCSNCQDGGTVPWDFENISSGGSFSVQIISQGDRAFMLSFSEHLGKWEISNIKGWQQSAKQAYENNYLITV